MLTPPVVFASHAAAHSKATHTTVGVDVNLVAAEGDVDGKAADRSTTRLADSLATEATSDVAEARAQVTQQTVARFRFTSGPTHSLKGAVNAQRFVTEDKVDIIMGSRSHQWPLPWPMWRCGDVVMWRWKEQPCSRRFRPRNCRLTKTLRLSACRSQVP